MGELQTMIELTRDTNDKVNTIVSQLGAIEERCRSHQHQLNGHQLTLYGPNGSSGMVLDVSRLQSCKDSIVSQKNLWGEVLRDIVKWGAIALIGFLLYMWKIHAPGAPEKATVTTNNQGAQK